MEDLPLDPSDHITTDPLNFTIGSVTLSGVLGVLIALAEGGLFLTLATVLATGSLCYMLFRISKNLSIISQQLKKLKK